MKVFVSWSGDYAKAIAQELGSWLPCVVQELEVFLSTDSIDAGSRWTRAIDAALADTDFGIIVVTRDNYTAPWLLYEAGALAKNVTKSRVVPVLVDVSNTTLANSPLLHFQTVPMGKSGITDLVSSVHDQILEPLISATQLDRVFSHWWPELEKALSEITPPSVEDREEKRPQETDNNLEAAVSTLLSMVSELRSEFYHFRNQRIHGFMETDFKKASAETVERRVREIERSAHKAKNDKELSNIQKELHYLEESSGLLPYVFEDAWDAVKEAQIRLI